MSDRVPVEWLGDAREYALEARNLANGLTQAAFESDRRSQFAVCFCLVIVGEALNSDT